MNTMNNVTLVELSEFDAKLFYQFQKNYTFIKLLDSLGIFDLKTGNVVLHFDASGKIGAVEVNKKYVYNT